MYCAMLNFSKYLKDELIVSVTNYLVYLDNIASKDNSTLLTFSPLPPGAPIPPGGPGAPCEETAVKMMTLMLGTEGNKGWMSALYHV